MRKILRGGLILASGVLLALFGGPVLSGAIFLPFASLGSRVSGTITDDYRPFHKGSVDLATGLYVRENEDLVVPGSPGLILRRTYLSRYRQSREFGIGTTHNGEEFLIGDGQDFAWASLILARGSRINFKRLSPGTSLLNAVFEHHETRGEWYGARLGWTGFNWTLTRRDGVVMMFRGCGPGTVCSIMQWRGADMQTIYYRRDLAGRLYEIADGKGRWIQFDYDDARRITRAHASTKAEVRYSYDGRGRLITAATTGGPTSRYTYTDLDELATIEEPGTSIENIYASERCVRQTNRYPDGEPLVFTFDYALDGTRIVRTTSRRSDGQVNEFTWDEARRVVTESRGREGYPPLRYTLERDALTGAVTTVKLACPDFGRGAREFSGAVTAEKGEAEVKARLGALCLR
jgi:YD repeat-containing protein